MTTADGDEAPPTGATPPWATPSWATPTAGLGAESSCEYLVNKAERLHCNKKEMARVLLLGVLFSE